jgi:hypothetical protein
MSKTRIIIDQLKVEAARKRTILDSITNKATEVLKNIDDITIRKSHSNIWKTNFDEKKLSNITAWSKKSDFLSSAKHLFTFEECYNMSYTIF